MTLLEKCLLTHHQKDASLDKYLELHPQYEGIRGSLIMPILRAQLEYAIPIISEEIRAEEREDYGRKLKLKEEMVTKRVTEEIKRELEELGTRSYKYAYDYGRFVFEDLDIWDAYWEGKGVK